MEDRPSEGLRSPPIFFLYTKKLSFLPPAMHSVSALAQAGLNVVVLEYLRDGQPATEGLDPAVRMVGIKKPSFGNVPSFLRVWLHALHYLVCVAQQVQRHGRPSAFVGNDLVTEIWAWLLAGYYGTPFVIHAHELNDGGMGIGLLPFQILEGVAYRTCRFWVCADSGKIEYLRRKFEVEGGFLVCNTPSLRPVAKPIPLRKKLGIPRNHRLMIFLGGIGPDKTIAPTIEACALVPNLTFLLVGWGEEGYLGELRALVRARGLEERVKFLPTVSHLEKWSYLAAADLGVCLYNADSVGSFHNTTGPNKIFEYLSQGLAVILPGRESYRAFFERYGCAEFVTTQDAAGIAAAIRKTIAPRVLAMRQRNSREAFESDLHFDKQFRDVLECYTELSGVSLSRPVAKKRVA